MLRGSRRKDGPTGRRINLTTASMLSSILRTLVSVLPGAIILPVVIHLIKFRSLIDYHADQVRIVQRLQTLLQGLKRGHTLPDYEECAVYQSGPQVGIDDRQHGSGIYHHPIKSA